MNYPIRRRYFDATSLFVHTGLAALSSYITALITEKRHSEVNNSWIFVGWSALIACALAIPICSGLRDLEEAKHTQYRLRESTFATISILMWVAVETFLTVVTSSLLRCTTAEDPKNCQTVSPELAATAALISNLITLLALWPLAKWSAITAEEIAIIREARREVALEQGGIANRGEEGLTQISQLPNAEVIANCPVTFAPPQHPVRFACPTGNYLDPAGNRVSTAYAFERAPAQRILRSRSCPTTRRPVTRLVAALDVLNRAEPTAPAELHQPLLPSGTYAAPPDGNDSAYGTFAPGHQR